MDGPDDDIDPQLRDAEVDHLIAMLGIAQLPDATADEVAAELRHLESLRSSYRRSRWAITELWIAIAGMLVVLFAAGWWLLVPPVAAFTLVAVHRGNTRDVSGARGRELDADIADARARLREMRGEDS
jgi:hypothetical protein